MPKFFITNKEIEKDKIEINGKDVNHIKNVLRKKEGETLNICKIEEEKIQLKALNKIEQNTESNIKVSIYQGLPKADKMELIIQKAVELGVYDITPVEMKRSIVKLNEKDKIKKIERWQKISEVASKQCGRSIIPQIKSIKTVKNICQESTNYDIVIVAYEKEKNNTLKEELKKIKEQTKKDLKIAIVIGPEGGIEDTEIQELKQNGAKTVTLGERILRTETVALNVLSIVMYEFEK